MENFTFTGKMFKKPVSAGVVVEFIIQNIVTESPGFVKEKLIYTGLSMD